MKKILLSTFVITALLAFAGVASAAAPNWDVSGSYVWTVLGTYTHDLTLVQSPDGLFTGTGGYPAGGSYQTTEVISGGLVDGNTITFTTTYDGPYNSGYTVTVSGTIAPDGTMSGNSPWEWHSTSGNASSLKTVTCPANTTATSFQTINVPAGQASDISSNSLANGTDYLIKASGEADAGDGITFDARYSIRAASSPTTWTDAVSTYEGLGIELLDLLVDGATPWGDYNKLHEYSFLKTGADAPVSLRIYDTYPSNNTGNLVVDIYSCTPNPEPLPVPTDMSQCKKDGWQTFKNLAFKNQGDCVSYVQSNSEVNKTK